MSMFDRFNLPATPEADTLKKYYQAQLDLDFSSSTSFFTDDVTFNGLMYQMKGIESTSSSFVEFLKKFPVELKFEGVSMLEEPKRCMVLLSVTPKGEKAFSMCELLHFRDGKIFLIENCFDVSATPKTIQDDAEEKATDE